MFHIQSYFIFLYEHITTWYFLFPVICLDRVTWFFSGANKMSPSEKPTLTERMKAGPSVHSLLTASVFPNKL